MKITELLWDLFDLGLTGMAGAARRVALMEKPPPSPPPSEGITVDIWSRVQAGKTYLRGLLRLTLVCACFPLFILTLGMLLGVGWLVAIAGIFWALCTLLLLLLAAPLGMLIEVITGGFKGIGARYVRFSLGLFLVELLFALFVSIVPIANNPSALPIVILAASILGILAALAAKTSAIQKWVGVVVGIVFVLFTLSFFLPKTMGQFGEKVSGLDESLSGSARKSGEGALRSLEETIIRFGTEADPTAPVPKEELITLEKFGVAVTSRMFIAEGRKFKWSTTAPFGITIMVNGHYAPMACNEESGEIVGVKGTATQPIRLYKMDGLSPKGKVVVRLERIDDEPPAEERITLSDTLAHLSVGTIYEGRRFSYHTTGAFGYSLIVNGRWLWPARLCLEGNGEIVGAPGTQTQHIRLFRLKDRSPDLVIIDLKREE